MKPIRRLAYFMFMLGLSTGIFADNVVSTFNIGDVPHQTVSPEMIDKSRAIAVEHANDLLHFSGDVVAGNPNGSTTLVQFVDFLCSLSEKMDPAIQQLIKANPDLRVVYKQYPLRGSVSVFAAKAALAANKQGKYLPFHIALMQQAGNLDEAKILALAKTAGVDVVQLNKDMAANSFAVEIANAHDLATKIAIPGTPALFFAKTNLSEYDGINLLLFLLGLYDQAALQNAVNNISRQN